jgi:hypothetical protein
VAGPAFTKPGRRRRPSLEFSLGLSGGAKPLRVYFALAVHGDETEVVEVQRDAFSELQKSGQKESTS